MAPQHQSLRILAVLLAVGTTLATPFVQPPLRRDEELTAEMVADSIATGPEECDDFLFPSEDCVNAMQASREEAANEDFVGIAGGKLQFPWNSGCNDHKNVLSQAASDAYVISQAALEDSSNVELTPIWTTWFGPDHVDWKGRILGNFGRISDFKQNKKYDIYMSCNDPHEHCNKEYKGKTIRVGGYAFEYRGFWGYYRYINFSPTFFTLDPLSVKIKSVGENLERGDGSYANQADWQRNHGQYFLHEMMHLNATSGPEPWIDDEPVDPDGVGMASKAYGPRMVYKLAQRNPNQGGGAKRASTNADSYAWFANSVLFYENFGKYPVPPNYKDSVAEAAGPIVAEDLADEGPFFLDLGEFEEGSVTEELVNERMEEALAGIVGEVESDEEEDQPDPNEHVNGPNSPQCDDVGEKRFSEGEANNLIDDFCGGVESWNNLAVVPPILVGTGRTEDDGSKTLGIYDHGPIVENGDMSVWSGVTFAQEDCSGVFSLAGDDVQKNIDECKSHLQSILSGCGGSGGALRNSCDVWYLKLSASDPTDEHWKDMGEIECGDLCSDDACRDTLGDSPLADACTCWYSNYDTVTGTFGRPESGKCDPKDVDLTFEFVGGAGLIKD